MKLTGIAFAGVMAAAGAAKGEIYGWEWDRGDPGSKGLNMRGGTFESVRAKYDTQTERFRWETTFTDQITDGYMLAVNDGPNPKGARGRARADLLRRDDRGPDRLGLRVQRPEHPEIV